jgi:uncharacterized protein YdaU (DUF1376 family)
MNGLPYYKRYPRDFIEGTIGMPFEEKAAYGLVLDLIYMQNGRLPDDPRYIAGLLGLSVRRWNAIRASLLASGKLQIIGGSLTNYRAIIELQNLGKFQDKQAENGRQPKKNNALHKPSLEFGLNHTESEPDTEVGREGLSKDNPPPPSGGGGFSDQDFNRLIAAVGYDPEGHIPTAWDERGSLWADGWIAKGLTPDRIIAAAKASREYHPEPPATPQALDKAMDRALARPAPAAAPATIEDMIEFWAAKLNGDGYVAPSAVKPDLARAMMAAGRVTPEKLRERGIAE